MIPWGVLSVITYRETKEQNGKEENKTKQRRDFSRCVAVARLRRVWTMNVITEFCCFKAVGLAQVPFLVMVSLFCNRGMSKLPLICW